MTRYKIHTTDNSVYFTDVLDMERLASEVMIMFVPKNGPTRGKRTFCFRENITLIEDSQQTKLEETVPVWVIEADGSITLEGLHTTADQQPTSSIEAILDLIRNGEVVPMDAWEHWLLEDR